MSKALGLANLLKITYQGCLIPRESAAELRRLHELNAELVATLDTLIAIVGLTVFKYESQRDVLQEAVDNGQSILDKAKEQA